MDICRRQMQIRSDKEVLAECYRIWLVIQHPNEFDEYRKTIKIGKGKQIRLISNCFANLTN